jgi:hypothetical protein
MDLRAQKKLDWHCKQRDQSSMLGLLNSYQMQRFQEESAKARQELQKSKDELKERLLKMEELSIQQI